MERGREKLIVMILKLGMISVARKNVAIVPNCYKR